MATKKKTNTVPPMRPRAETITEFPAPPPPGSRLPSKPPPKQAKQAKQGKPAKKPRDPVEVVREAIGELAVFDEPRSAAAVCAAALALGLGARGVVIHAYDAREREIRIVAANGPKGASLVGKATPAERDIIASTVIANGAPMKLIIDTDDGLPRRAPERLHVIGASQTVVAVPALVKNRVVAIVEVIDAKETAATAVEPAADYAASALAQFLVARKKR